MNYTTEGRKILSSDPELAPTQRCLMTSDEVAAYLRVPVATIYAWRYRGGGPRAMRVGRHLRFRQGDVEAWLEKLSAD